MEIAFIQCGGTIDKDYPKTRGGYGFEITNPACEKILERLNPTFTYQVIPLFQKDSLDLTEHDRDKLAEVCNTINENYIIVTHGTDTMIETAKHLSVIKTKTIILTGSMKPERFKDADADVNLGVAVGAISFVPKGIYIAMNGKVIPWEKAERHPESGIFREKK